MSEKIQKIYCYVDETGQDAGSGFFIVVTVIATDPMIIRQIATEFEQTTQARMTKWHKLSHSQRLEFLLLSLKLVGKCIIYYAEYKKNVPFFESLAKTIHGAICDFASQNYKAIVCVDGIDKKKAGELTVALRQGGIPLKYVRSARDESEPLIRLADRWAGCIRLALKGNEIFSVLLSQAKNRGLIKQI